jgi:Tol biopolymer transport system component
MAERDNLATLDLFLQNTSGGEPIQLTATPDRAEFSTAWSPRGDQIAFSTLEPLNSGRTCRIFTRFVPDGEEREVARCVGANYTGRLSWSPTGDRLLFADNSGPDPNATRSVIRELDLATGEAATIVPPQTGADDFNPSYSPDGARVLFVRHTAWASAQVMVYDVRSQRIRPVTNDRTSLAYAAWAPDGRSAIVSSNRSGIFDLWQFPLDGATPRRLGAPYALRPAVSGDLVTFELNRFSTNIMLLQGGRESPLTTGDQFHFFPNFAPDGSLAFTSIEGGSWLYISRAGQPPRRSIEVDALFPRSLRWSNDSQRIAFVANTNYVAHIFIADIASGRIIETPTQGIEPLSLSWGLDGESLLFAAREEQGVRIWRVQDRAGARAEPITDFGWADALETEEGLFAANLLFDQREGPGVYRIGQGGSAVRLTPDVDNASQLVAWAMARGTLYYLLQRQRGQPVTLLARSISRQASGPARIVAQLDPGAEGLAVHPGGEVFALARETSSDQDIGLARLRRD